MTLPMVVVAVGVLFAIYRRQTQAGQVTPPVPWRARRAAAPVR